MAGINSLTNKPHNYVVIGSSNPRFWRTKETVTSPYCLTKSLRTYARHVGHKCPWESWNNRISWLTRTGCAVSKDLVIELRFFLFPFVIFVFFFFRFLGWGEIWVHLVSLPTIWPIVPAPDEDWWWVLSSRWNERQGKLKLSKKTLPHCRFVHHKSHSSMEVWTSRLGSLKSSCILWTMEISNLR
jgi:hypothetical protein